MRACRGVYNLPSPSALGYKKTGESKVCVACKMLRSYVVWWARQMLDLVPESVRNPDADAVDALLIEPEGVNEELPAAVSLLLRRRRKVGQIGRFACDVAGIEAMRRALANMRLPSAVWLCLPPGPMIEKRVTLPLGAERELERVVGYEMDRETPFTADEVWWMAAVETRDRALGKLAVRLSLVPRIAVSGLLAVLDRAGLRPTELYAAIEGEAPRRIALAAPSARSRARRLRTMPILAGTCAALVLAAIGLPFVQQALAFAAIEERIATLQPAAEEAETLRRRLAGSDTPRDLLAAQQARIGDPLKVLAAATSLLPDDTHLTDFAMHRRQLSMTGQSADAAKLIGLLAADPVFKDPAFSAPVTRSESRQSDIFSISAEARP